MMSDAELRAVIARSQRRTHQTQELDKEMNRILARLQEIERIMGRLGRESDEDDARIAQGTSH
jgi:hypothetical protein